MFAPAHPDDTFDIHEVGAWGRAPRIVRTCTHGRTVPVESLLGEVVAHLCLTCDTQLP